MNFLFSVVRSGKQIQEGSALGVTATPHCKKIEVGGGRDEKSATVIWGQKRRERQSFRSSSEVDKRKTILARCHTGGKIQRYIFLTISLLSATMKICKKKRKTYFVRN